MVLKDVNFVVELSLNLSVVNRCVFLLFELSVDVFESGWRLGVDVDVLLNRPVFFRRLFGNTSLEKCIHHCVQQSALSGWFGNRRVDSNRFHLFLGQQFVVARKDDDWSASKYGFFPHCDRDISSVHDGHAKIQNHEIKWFSDSGRYQHSVHD